MKREREKGQSVIEKGRKRKEKWKLGSTRRIYAEKKIKSKKCVRKL
jgi:hypothetical protein